MTKQFHGIGIKPQELRALAAVVDEDNLKQYATIIYFDKDCLVATDGFRLMTVKTEVPEALIGSRLQAEFLETIARHMNEGFNAVSIHRTEDHSQLEICVNRMMTMTIREPMITYPRYQGILPQNSHVSQKLETLELDIKETLASIKEKLSSADKSKAIEFHGYQVNGKYLIDAFKFLGKGSATVTLWGVGNPLIEVTKGPITTLIVPLMEKE